MFDPPEVAEPTAPDRRSLSDGRPVLGIDPGLSRCGYGAVHRTGATMSAVAYGVLRTDRELPLPERLATLETDLAELFDDLRPSAVAVERVLFQTNVRTAISVGQASGIALVVAARAGVPVTHYSPNEVKLSVTGSGTADKTQVQEMVTRLLALGQVPASPDAADALALALCHCWALPVQRAAGAADGDRSVAAAPGLVRAVAAALEREARS